MRQLLRLFSKLSIKNWNASFLFKADTTWEFLDFFSQPLFKSFSPLFLVLGSSTYLLSTCKLQNFDMYICWVHSLNQSVYAAMLSAISKTISRGQAKLKIAQKWINDQGKSGSTWDRWWKVPLLYLIPKYALHIKL